MWPSLVKIQKTSKKSHASSCCLTSCCQFYSHVVDIVTKQQPCCWCQNKAKPMLLMPVWLMLEKNKSSVDATDCQQGGGVLVWKMWFDQLFSINFYRTQIWSLPCLVIHWVTQFLLFFRLDWCDPAMWGFRQPLLTSCCQLWQPCCWSCNKAKTMLLMPEQNKGHVVDARTKQRPCCWCRNKTKALSNFVQIGFLKIVAWISLEL